MGLVPPKFIAPRGGEQASYQPLPIEAYYRLDDGTPCCSYCHEKITAYDVSCPHCGKRFTSGAPLKFGGYTSRDMLPEKIEQGLHASTATIRVMKRIEQDIVAREHDLPTGSNVIGTAFPPSPSSFVLTANTISWKYPPVEDDGRNEDWRKLIVREP